VTLLAGFGILMALYSRRKLVGRSRNVALNKCRNFLLAALACAPTGASRKTRPRAASTCSAPRSLNSSTRW